MKNITTLFLLLILISMILSCDENSFSQVVEIDIPEHESKLALRGIFNSVDQQLNLLVGFSLGILENKPQDKVIDQATVQLFKNGQLLNDFSYRADTGYYEHILPNQLGTAADLYRLEVSAPDYESVFSEQTMPTLVAIDKAEVIEQGTISDDGERVDELTFEFQDPPQAGDYYGISLVLENFAIDGPQDTFRYKETIYLYSNDPLLEDNYESPYSLIFSDANINGNKVKISTYAYTELANRPGTLRLHHLSRDAYLYARSLESYQLAVDNPFAEPTTVHTNIENGYGIFALSAVSEQRVGE